MEDKEYNDGVSNIIHNHINRHSCQIYHRENEHLSSLGSGVFVKFSDGRYFLVTAGHVAIDAKHEVYVRVPNGFIQLTGEALVYNPKRNSKLDLAYLTLESHLIPTLELMYSFLPHEKVGGIVNRVMLWDNNYHAVGWPIKGVPVGDEIDYEAAISLELPAARPEAFKEYKLNPKGHLILKMTGEMIMPVTGQIVNFDRPNGMSGCGMWQISAPRVSEGNYLFDYRLIAILTDYKTSKHEFANRVLIGNTLKVTEEKV